jgi:hypothetical protein
MILKNLKRIISPALTTNHDWIRQYRGSDFMFMYKILKPLFLSYTQKTVTYNFPPFNQPAFINSDQFLDEGRLFISSIYIVLSPFGKLHVYYFFTFAASLLNIHGGDIRTFQPTCLHQFRSIPWWRSVGQNVGNDAFQIFEYHKIFI